MSFAASSHAINSIDKEADMSNDVVAEIQRKMDALGNPEDAKAMMRFFKTGKGQYGEGDIFRGISTPDWRRMAKEYKGISVEDAERLLQSPMHEDRSLALGIICGLFEKADEAGRKRIFKLYLANSRRINNWDLVDCSAPQIVGGHLLDKDRSILRKLAASSLLWERRIAIVCTLTFIRSKQLSDTFALCEQLLFDKEDLMHKACGWMLREAGKRDLPALETFLQTNVRKMPRTMLRYAIERFPKDKYKSYLAIKREIA